MQDGGSEASLHLHDADLLHECILGPRAAGLRDKDFEGRSRSQRGDRLGSQVRYSVHLDRDSDQFLGSFYRWSRRVRRGFSGGPGQVLPSQAGTGELQTVEWVYVSYQLVCQVCDSLILDIETKAFRGGLIVCSVVYLTLCIRLDIFSQEELAGTRFTNQNDLIERASVFNQVFSKFSRMCLDIDFNELVPYIKYCTPHMDISAVFGLPSVIEDTVREVGVR